MRLEPAAPGDLPAVAELVNSAYRGESSRRGWTTEADLIGGQRTDAASLARDLAARPGSQILLLRGTSELLGCVWLEPTPEPGVWYLGMLTIRPDRQDGGLGRRLLAEAERAAKGLGARRLRMSVISLRDELIGWYVRRGYRETGERRPFPYGDPSIGDPLRDDLEFVVLEKSL